MALWVADGVMSGKVADLGAGSVGAASTQWMLVSIGFL